MISLNIITTSVRPELVEGFSYFVVRQAHYERCDFRQAHHERSF